MCDCSAHNGFLTAKGLEETAQRLSSRTDELDGMDLSHYLDKVGSVSGSHLMDAHWDAALIEEQYQRFHNGS